MHACRFVGSENASNQLQADDLAALESHPEGGELTPNPLDDPLDDDDDDLEGEEGAHHLGGGTESAAALAQVRVNVAPLPCTGSKSTDFKCIEIFSTQSSVPLYL